MSNFKGVIKTDDQQYTVVIGNKSYDFGPSHDSFLALIQCIQTSDSEDFLRLYDKSAEIEDFSHGHVKVKDGVLMYKGYSCHPHICDRVTQMIRDGFDYVPMFNFIERLYKNPSNRAINELFDFLMNKGLPITEDGYVLGYKGVAVHHGPDIVDVAGQVVTEGDYIDNHTRKTHRYNPGDVAEMPRHAVCDDPDISCAAGLHVGSPSYSSWTSHPVIVAFDPSDMVSVPKSDSEKARVCKYTILSDYESDFKQIVASTHIDEDCWSEDCWSEDCCSEDCWSEECCSEECCSEDCCTEDCCTEDEGFGLDSSHLRGQS